MRGVQWLPVLMLLVPQTAFALQLRWSGGSTELSFTGGTRCTLVVQTSSAEGHLPSQWRLLWVADSLSLQFAAMDSLGACLLDVAQVFRIDAPATVADSAANMITAHFCSLEGSPATIAFQVVDLPSGGRGRLKVVALDSDDPDSSGVIESNEVTYNGGIDGDYPPVVLHSSSVHQSLQLKVTVVGSGLNAASSMAIRAKDSSWSLPVTITSRSDVVLTGVASVAALLPECQTIVGAESGASSAGNLSADEEPAFQSPLSCSAQYFEELLLPPPPGHGYTIQPKDFAFTRGFIDAPSDRYALHLFYIRRSYYNIPPDANEKNIGHIWTTDFNSWYGPGGLNKPDTLALVARPGKFDELHVWAPTIVQHGPIFRMFYTGVRSDLAGGPQHQRIGVATSTDLITWTPADAPVLTAPEVPWAKKDPAGAPYFGAQQLRDPFVMPDPINPGQWLMYFVAVDSLRTPKMAVGAARSSNLLTWQAFDRPFSSTQRPSPNGVATTIVESPHVFRRNSKWWMPYTVNGDTVFFETTASADPADTVAANWSNPVWLRGVSEGQPSELQYWHASEHLRVTAAAEYLAAWDDNASSIDIKGVFAPANAAVDSFRLDCPIIAGVGDGEDSRKRVRMTVSRLRWGTPEVVLRLELPTRMVMRLAVYDIAGRRRTTLLDSELQNGVTEVIWDGRDQGGTRVASGVYFLRLTFAGGEEMSKIVMLR